MKFSRLLRRSQGRQDTGESIERWFRWRGFLAGAALVLVIASAYVYAHKDLYTDDFAEVSRSLIGDENTARLESWYFAVQDRIDRTRYTIFGGDTNPFPEDPDDVAYLPTALSTPAYVDEAPTATRVPGATLTPVPPLPTAVPTPEPMVRPPVRQVSASLEPGEGVWTTEGLPRTSPDDVLMAKTFVRPDLERPYALAGILLVDHRRVRLHMTGGTDSPGGDRGVQGPGAIATEHLPDLLVAWNGGFRGPHGGFGMYADGREYRPLRNGFASVAVYEDGSIRIGQWGRDLTWSDELVAVRQNAALLVEDCEVSSRTNEGNDTWGYVQVDSSEFITWRSGIGLTANGDLLVVAGNSLSAPSLARALWAAGACWAMQLDINSPYVLTSVFSQQPDGTIEASKFMQSMPGNPARFLGIQPNDFLYLTYDETNHVP